MPTEGARLALIRESQINEARAALVDALDRLEAAQADKRGAAAAAGQAVEEEKNALLEAEWVLDGRFRTEGNKTLLVGDDGSTKAMTADERKAWKQAEARKQPNVVDAAAAARKLQDAEQVATDALILAERRFTACKHALDAAVAHLNFLAATVTVDRTGAS